MQTSIVRESTRATEVESYVRDTQSQILYSKVIEMYVSTEAKNFEKLIRINLIGCDFDSTQTYSLIATYLETGQVTEYLVQIDIAFYDNHF